MINTTGKSLPTGTVTFLFTDIEGSTKLAQQYPDEMPSLLARHHAVLHQAIEKHNGYVFQIIGDAFCAAFHTAPEAFKAALAAQQTLVCEPWHPAPIKVRMGIHTGAAQAGAIEDKAGGYVGYLTLTRVQRVMSLAHGGQILLSNSTAELVRSELPKQVSLRDMGEHHLKGLVNPDHLWQLLAPDLPGDFPALQSLKTIPNNLPVQLTSFIGREKELAEIKQSLAEHRLVTLTGSGGAGKSRLSLQVATDSLDRFCNGIWLVELAPLAEPGLIPQTILSAAGIQTQQGPTALETLTDFLREKTALLVLDNCEHLIDACARLVETLLNAAPNLKILASSREALGVKGEQAWRVPSLSVPDIKRPPSFEQLLQYEAVCLFVERALLVQPHFVVTNENAAALTKICQRLDGIPLALELAAARLRTLSVEQIAVRLDDSFRLLTGGTRTALPRQQTLRALIDWSYNLLSEPEKILFRRLAVFVGGWTLEAAESVCSSPEGGIESEDVLDLLDHLVDKSLVISANDGNETRYRRLETIRQYAREKLVESGEAITYRTRHLTYFLKWAQDLEPGLRGPQQVELLDRLENEIDNLRAALEWAQDSDPEAGLRLASMLKWFWHMRNHSRDGIGWLDKFINAETERFSRRSDFESETFDLTKALLALGFLKADQGDIQNAILCAKESLRLCEKISGRHGILFRAECFLYFGAFALFSGDLAQARNLAQQSLELYQSCGDKFGIAEVQTNVLTVIALQSGELETAQKLSESNLAIRRELRDRDGTAYALWNGGIVALHKGDYEYARKMFLTAIEASYEAKSDYMLGVSFGNLGVTCLFQGEPDQAREYILQGAKLAQEKWNSDLKAVSICWLALYYFEHEQFRKFIELNSFLERENLLFMYFYLAPIIRAVLQKNFALARAELSDADFHHAEANGKAMTLDQVFAYALEGIND